MIDFDAATALANDDRTAFGLFHPEEATLEYRAMDLPNASRPDPLTVNQLTQPIDEYRAILRAVSDEVAEPLAEVENGIRRALETDDEILRPMLEHVAELGGKRLRPIMLLLSAKACGGVTDEAIRLAVAVELVHTATLVHDDILDEADYRRHRPALHRVFDRQASLLVGDWLFTEAYRLCNESTSTLPGRWLAQAAKDVCLGEIRQSKLAGDWTISLDDYLQIIGMKTGSLCAISCRLGAWAGGADDSTIGTLHDFGWKVGQAFQIHDDYLDYFGQATKLGKPLGNDLRDGKLTLPLVFFIQRASLADVEKLKVLTKERTAESLLACRKLMRVYGVDAATQRSAEALSQSAIHDFAPIYSSDPAAPNPSLELLEKLALTAVRRAA
jgi:octaprenyl-diphosphate synthase